MEEEWFCFIEEANFHIIDKQLLTQLSQAQFRRRASAVPN